MLPLVGVPPLVAKGLASYRQIFCREAGFEHVSRYLTGLLLSPNTRLGKLGAGTPVIKQRNRKDSGGHQSLQDVFTSVPLREELLGQV